MKKIKKYMISLLAVTALGMASNSSAFFGFSAPSAQDLFIEFKDMASAHKVECIELMAKAKEHLFKLIVQHTQAWNKFSDQAIKDLASATTPQNRERIFRTLLNSAMLLHQRENGEWREKHAAMSEQRDKVDARHDEALVNFGQKVSKYENSSSESKDVANLLE